MAIISFFVLDSQCLYCKAAGLDNGLTMLFRLSEYRLHLEISCPIILHEEKDGGNFSNSIFAIKAKSSLSIKI